jgi:serine/threonine protein kinase
MTQNESESERLFAEFTHRVRRGERLSIHELCAQFPGCADELRARYNAWRDEQRASATEGLAGETIDVACCGRDDPAWRDFVATLQTRKTSFERFRFAREIANGPTATLHEIYDPDTRRRLALKRAHCADGVTLGRFLEEAQLTAQLQHPSVVPVHELGVDPDGRPWYTMQFLEGEDLRAVFDRVKRREAGWTPFRALLVLIKVCEAMAHAHGKGVIHRDLRPATILVGQHGDTYVMEWGRARVLAEPETLLPPPKTRIAGDVERVTFSTQHHANGTPDSPLQSSDGLIGGSPAYMSPEQIEGDFAMVNARSDVYSVGAMLYELLSGEVPYCDHGTRLSPGRILEAVILGPPTPLRELAPQTPDSLIAITEKAMRRVPADRTPSMQVLADELIAALDRDLGLNGAAGATGSFLRRLKHAMFSSSGALLAAALHRTT